MEQENKKIEKQDIQELFKKREKDTHKGDYGYVGIMGGCVSYSGAIKLANMSCCALRSGAGVVRVIVPESIAPSITPYLLEQTIFTIEDEEGKMIFQEKQMKEALSKLTALAIGNGWGEGKDNEKILKYILENYQIPVVIDADGLNTLAKMDKEILKTTKCTIILTPHKKEFERISGILINDMEKQEIEIAKTFAKQYGVILLLKGPTTIVTNGEKVFLVETGCPGMATAGSGDVLSGILVGLLGYQKADILTVAAGSYLAGLAGEIAQKKKNDISMIASDTIESIPEAINQIREEIK